VFPEERYMPEQAEMRVEKEAALDRGFGFETTGVDHHRFIAITRVKRRENMFCYQCEQTAGGSGCTKAGVCGKNEDIQSLQDTLLFGLKALPPTPITPGAWRTRRRGGCLYA
jgi:hypothetical protein